MEEVREAAKRLISSSFPSLFSAGTAVQDGTITRWTVERQSEDVSNRRKCYVYESIPESTVFLNH